MDEPVSLLRNDTKIDNSWLKLQLRGVKSNRSAIGSVVTIYYGDRKQTAIVTSQSSFLSVNDRRLHFGLGDVKQLDRILVRWPSGALDEFGRVPAKSMYELFEGTGVAKPVSLPK